MMPAFLQRLNQMRTTLSLRRWVFVSLAIVIGTLLVLTAVDTVTRHSGLQESTALVLVLAALVTFILGPLAAAWLVLHFHPSPRQLAAKVEQAQPELMDSLNAAVELAGQTSAPRTTLEAGLFARTDEITGKLDLTKILIPAYLRVEVLLVGLICVPVLLYWFSTTPLVQRATYAWHDWRSNTTSGLTIQPDVERVALGSDLTLRVRINRWEQVATIQFDNGTSRETHPMPINRQGEATFTFYGVEAPLTYSISTPSLHSGERSLDVYVPPSLQKIQIEVTPPAYTALPKDIFESLQDFSAPAGSLITIQAETSHTDALELVHNEVASPLNSTSPQQWTHDWLPGQSGPYNLRLTNHYETNDSAAYRLTIIPDEPPVVEILHPGKDIELEPDGLIALMTYFADDYGLANASLQISVVGRMQTSFPIRLEPSEDGSIAKEVKIPFGLELASLEVEDGDLISYWVQVSDNREPTPQFSRSEVFFVEVKVEREPEEMEGSPMEDERITLRPQIEELKRLLRLSHRTVTLEQDDRLANNQELASALLNLRKDLQKMYDDLKPRLEEAGDEFFTNGFNNALSLIDSARGEITHNLTELSIPLQEQALHQLLAIENALVVEQISKEPSEGSGEGESGEGEEGEQGEMSESEMAALSDALEKLQELSRDQNAQNSRMDRAASSGATQAEMNALGNQQDQLRQDLNELDQALAAIPDTGDARGALLQAEQRMRGAGNSLGANDASRAAREGLRAAENLEAAARLLEDRLDAALSEALQAMQDQANQMAGQQSAAAQASGQAAQGGPADGEGMTGGQRGLNEDLAGLLDRMEQLAREMQSTNPEAARALSQAARQARDGNPGSSMSRAANALLYEMFEQAQSLQEEAASGLQELAGAIGESGSSLPTMSERQLERLLQELQQDRNELAGMSAEEMSQGSEKIDDTRESWSERLERLANQTGDSRMEGIAQGLGMGGGDTESRLRDAVYLLEEASSVLENYRQLLQRRQILELRRRSAPPPEDYRQQVESYFRQLAEENQ